MEANFDDVTEETWATKLGGYYKKIGGMAESSTCILLLIIVVMLCVMYWMFYRESGTMDLGFLDKLPDV